MPLIIITGHPSSGKSFRRDELKRYFEENGKTVHVVDESDIIRKSGIEKNAVYKYANQEKKIRDMIKSDVIRLIGRTDLVILDGLNYIKGCRYELYCASKANHCNQCTIHVVVSNELAWELNENRTNECEKYSREIFDALIMRYEDPDSKNRWDSPLFHAYRDEKLDCDAISNCLFKTETPKPNNSTQNAPLNSTNFLYDLNRITKEITNKLISQIIAGNKSEVTIQGYEDYSIDVSNATVPQVVSLSRQYLCYSKLNTPDIANVPNLYIQYLKANLN